MTRASLHRWHSKAFQPVPLGSGCEVRQTATLNFSKCIAPTLLAAHSTSLGIAFERGSASTASFKAPSRLAAARIGPQKQKNG